MGRSSYDFIAIGGGSGGYAAARTNCDLGLPADKLTVDFEAIVKRKDALIDDFAGNRSGPLENGKFDLFCGCATFTGSDSLEVSLNVRGPHEVVHIAINQGEKAAGNAAVFLEMKSGEKKAIDYRLKLLGIFTDPQVAMVGLTELEVKGQGINFRSASYPFDDQGKSMIMGEQHGFVKLLADSSTGKLLGGAVVGPETVELIHEIVVAMNFGATASEFLEIPHYHPTLSEIWTYPDEDLIV